MTKIISINNLNLYQKQSFKIGILGGSFDPPHFGHIHIAKMALEHLDLDEIWFSISPQNITKPKHRYNYSERKKQVLSQIEKYNKFKILELEYELGIIYTSDLFEFLTQRLRDTKFYFIMGADLVTQIESWSYFEKLCSLTTLVFFSRGGYKANISKLESLMKKYINIKYIETDEVNVSSTQIKEQQEKI
ncbi:MAG: nicotinate (nicotinamide) nucleotide adenylyltransferase [Rickettsiaceae bacterium]|nr:nicotinate (nicotinamide) nucleotide adenylyltransferase [Rickettsiaceae bacterium]